MESLPVEIQLYIMKHLSLISINRLKSVSKSLLNAARTAYRDKLIHVHGEINSEIKLIDHKIQPVNNYMIVLLFDQIDINETESIRVGPQKITSYKYNRTEFVGSPMYGLEFIINGKFCHQFYESPAAYFRKIQNSKYINDR